MKPSAFYSYMSEKACNANFGLEYLLKEGLTERASTLIQDGITFCHKENTEQSKKVLQQLQNIINTGVIPSKEEIRKIQHEINDMNDYVSKQFNLIRYKERVRML